MDDRLIDDPSEALADAAMRLFAGQVIGWAARYKVTINGSGEVVGCEPTTITYIDTGLN